MEEFLMTEHTIDSRTQSEMHMRLMTGKPLRVSVLTSGLVIIRIANKPTTATIAS
ncbi:hypothetical protein Hanom_Chr01g00041731 [Helianthus anomalus]